MKSGGVVSEDLINILAEHCRDSSLMVRKLMVGSLTELVKVRRLRFCTLEEVSIDKSKED